MSKFDRFMLNALLVSFGIIAISFLLLYSYMDKEDFTFREMVESPSSFFYINDDNVSWNWSTDKRNASSRYDTISLYEEDTFTVVPHIDIESSIESIEFIYEDREDIKVIFERELPDTPNYKVTYFAEEISGHLTIEVDMDVRSIYSDRDYEGSIKIYLPQNHRFDSINILSHIADYELILPMVYEADVDVDFGSLAIKTTEPLDKLKASIDAGDLDVTVSHAITYAEFSINTGELDFDIEKAIDHLKVTNDIGAIAGHIDVSPTIMEVTCNLGDVVLNFDDEIISLEASLDIGDLNIDVVPEDESVVYTNNDLVDYSSRLKKTNRKSDANIWVTMNIGEIDIH